MIKATRKPLDQILDLIQGCSRILTIGCGGCVSVCLAGGQPEVNRLANELNLTLGLERAEFRIDGTTVERQCNARYLEQLEESVSRYDCLLSMACGAGVQMLAERFPAIPVYPAINTVAIGIDRDIGVYEERCRACGECVLGYTGGICPVTRCAKSLFNGPCGGTSHGRCEISSDIPCAWHKIYSRLSEQGRVADILMIRPAMEWQSQIQRTVVQDLYAERYVDNNLAN